MASSTTSAGRRSTSASALRAQLGLQEAQNAGRINADAGAAEDRRA
jgi:hypothetical protein